MFLNFSPTTYIYQTYIFKLKLQIAEDTAAQANEKAGKAKSIYDDYEKQIAVLKANQSDIEIKYSIREKQLQVNEKV